MPTTTITPFLWFDTQAEEAMNFYCGLFTDSKKLGVHRAGERVLTVTFELQGQKFIGLNGGPQFPFTEAVSFQIIVETQQEVDDLWTRLIAGGGQESRCGWLKDRYGLSWQVVPSALPRLLSDPDPARAGAAMQAILKMNKISIADMENAAAGAVR
jgi:predicted 3-demethylubiquinone-9 3-methyltransferase (glyoxalase superfamily)